MNYNDRGLLEVLGPAAFVALKKYGRIARIRTRDGFRILIPRGEAGRALARRVPFTSVERSRRLEQLERELAGPRRPGQVEFPRLSADDHLFMNQTFQWPAPPTPLRYSSGQHPSVLAEVARRDSARRRARLLDIDRGR